MAYPIDKKLVIAVASSALFDLTDSHRIFRDSGVDAYRQHQRDHELARLKPGVAFPLIRRLLKLNEGVSEDDAPVEVILLSRNDPDTGLRVFNSIEGYGLPISRAGFVNGGNPYPYMRAFNAALFLSANVYDVRSAIAEGLPAGRVFPTLFADNEDDHELRIAFDFDGVIADDSAEAIFRKGGLETFLRTESDLAATPHAGGPLAEFFSKVATLQRFEKQRTQRDPKYKPRLRTAIVTARNAPAHKRVVTTLRNWGIEVDEVFFLGGIEKGRVLKLLKPHIFFDDQLRHIEGIAEVTPCAHVPFGVANQQDSDTPIITLPDTSLPSKIVSEGVGDKATVQDS